MFTTLNIHRVADREALQPAYDHLATVIREVDSSALIFFAAVTWDDVVPAGFTAAPGGEEFSDRSVFTYHFYTPPQFSADVYFRTRVRDANRLHVASMLTEFERNRPDNDTVTDPFVAYAEVADAHLQSWTMWEMKTFCAETEESIASGSQAAAYGSCKTGYGERLIWDDAGNLNPAACRKLSRTYPQRVAGVTKTMAFNATTGLFKMAFETDTNIDEPTVVYANLGLNYPAGVAVTVVPPHALRHEVHKATNTISFWSPTDRKARAEVNGQLVTITLSNGAGSA